RAQPRLDPAGFGKIDKVNRKGAFSAMAEAPRDPERTKNARWACYKHVQKRRKQAHYALAQDIPGAFTLEFVFFVDVFRVRPAQCNSHDLEPVPFEGQDFATDETMAGCGILID